MKKKEDNFKIRITYPDGRIECLDNVTETYRNAIMYMGLKNVKGIGIIRNSINIVSTKQEMESSTGKREDRAIKELNYEDELGICTQMSTNAKYKILIKINEILKKGLKIELIQSVNTTPDWKKLIRIIGSALSEKSIINLVMLQAILNRIACLKKPLDGVFVVSEEDELLRESFVKLNPLSNIGFEKAMTLCDDTEFYYRKDGKLIVRELWIKALSEGDALNSLSRIAKDKADKLVKEYANTAPIIEPVEDFDDDTDEVQSKISKDGKTLIRVSENVEKYEIPAEIEVIGSGSFANCVHLTEVIFNDKLVRIESGAFIGCSSLEDINVPKSVMKIGTDAFKDTKIEEGQLAYLYATQSYFTPSDLSILPDNNIFVYGGDEDKKMAIEFFDAKADPKTYLNGRAISIRQSDDRELTSTQVEEFINYAIQHSDRRFVVVSSAYGNEETSRVVDLWHEANNINNIILPFALYSAIEEAENNNVNVSSI